jgi:glycosyltransferase involved in cell wall biosynthesis
VSRDGRTRVVYFVSPSPHFAGIERTVHEIATGLMEAHGDLLDVHVVFGSAYDEAILRDTAYRLHVLGVSRLRELALAVRSTLASIRPGVLVVPQVEASFIVWCATRGLRIPVFLAHLHGNPIVEERRGSRRSKAAFAVFRRVIGRRIAGVLAVSPSLARYAEGDLTPHVPVRFVPNPVRALAVPPDVVRDGPFTFVSVARLSYQKGQDVLLRAIASARDGLVGTRTVLVGEGPDRAALESLVEELGIGELVELAGYTTDPGAHLAAADCFVLASRWEGFGVVLVEALQYGLPIVAADCDFGPADVVTSPRIGELVPVEDAAALGAAMVRARSHHDEPEARAARRAVAAEFEREPAVEVHFATLTELARPSASARVAALTAGAADARVGVAPDR